MKQRVFKTKNGLELIVKHRKSAVIFEADVDQTDEKFRFTSEDFNELLTYIETISNESWKELSPKDANSLGSDYYEYYDKELDNNGYLRIGENELLIERPSSESERLYQFNKRKMESFIYDFRKKSIK